MPTVPNAARATDEDGAAWRPCTDCGRSAALAPDADLCAPCAPPRLGRVDPRAEDFTGTDITELEFAGSIFAEAVEDVAHHGIGDPGYWDCYGSGPDELARLRDALDRMQDAIRRTRKAVAVIERRARRRATRRQGRR